MKIRGQQSSSSIPRATGPLPTSHNLPIRANPILISGHRVLHPHIARYPDTSIAKKLNTTPGNPTSINQCQSVKIRGQPLPLSSSQSKAAILPGIHARYSLLYKMSCKKTAIPLYFCYNIFHPERYHTPTPSKQPNAKRRGAQDSG